MLAVGSVAESQQLELLRSLVINLGSADDAVRRDAARELASSASNPVYRAEIVRAGGIPQLVAALSSADEETKGNAAAVLVYLVSDPAHRAAIAVLVYLVSDPAYRAAIVGAGGVPQLVAALNSANEKIQENAARVLRWLAFDSTHRAAIVGAGAIPLLVAALGSEDDATKRHAAGTLAYLASNAAYRAEIARAGGVHLLVAALTSSRSVTKENARCALVALSETIEIKEQIRFEKMIQVATPTGSSTFISDLKVLLKDYANPGLFEGWMRHHRVGVQAFLAQPDSSVPSNNEGFLRQLGHCIGGLPESGTLRARIEYVAQKFGIEGLEGLMAPIPLPAVPTMPFAVQTQAQTQAVDPVAGVELPNFPRN